MKLSDAIDALKAFFLDILGYFIPGFFALIVLGYTIRPNLKYNSQLLGIDSSWNSFLIVFFSYVLGYVVYSLSDLTDKTLLKIRFLKLPNSNKIENDIEKSHEIEITKTALKELFRKKDGSPAFDDAKLDSLNSRHLRSIIMSYIPESDTKIYTFMFRSELCRSISGFAFFYGILGIIFSIINTLTNKHFLFQSNTQCITVYIILIITSYYFTKTRFRFLTIAYKIPFSIFLAKYFAIK
jgi:hypothetical protein